MGERAAAVQLIDVYAADESGACTVAVYDDVDQRARDIRVAYLFDSGTVEIPHACPWSVYGLRVVLFVERDLHVRELVSARVREAVGAYDPR
jgi:hypothetical protein